jgi:hypothetical protein
VAGFSASAFAISGFFFVVVFSSESPESLSRSVRFFFDLEVVSASARLLFLVSLATSVVSVITGSGSEITGLAITGFGDAAADAAADASVSEGRSLAVLSVMASAGEAGIESTTGGDGS